MMGLQKEQEENAFEAFRNLYSDFPIGQYVHDDQPDYLICSTDKTIGVEITQIFIDNCTNSSSDEKRKESLQSTLGDRLCEKLEQIIPFNFVLSIDYSTKDFAKNEIDRIVSACEMYFKNAQFPTQNFTSFDIDNLGQFPDEIDNLSFFKSPLKKSFYSEIAGRVLPDMTLKHLQVILDKKEDALKQYKICHEYWLLIEEGIFLSASFGGVSIGEFKTDFHKVFLYRHAKGELIQLK